MKWILLLNPNSWAATSADKGFWSPLRDDVRLVSKFGLVERHPRSDFCVTDSNLRRYAVVRARMPFIQ